MCLLPELRKAGVDASGMDVFGKVFVKVMRPILLGKESTLKKLPLITDTSAKGRGGVYPLPPPGGSTVCSLRSVMFYDKIKIKYAYNIVKGKNMK